MSVRRKRLKPFEWKPFSRKQKQILQWWRPGSPYQYKDILIADGSIRAGKTVSMIMSFIMWANSTFHDKDFIIAGRSVGALKRNVLTPMFQILEGMGLEDGRHYHYRRVEGCVEIGSNRFHLFGASTEKSQDVMQGLTAAGAYADEAALFPESFVNQMIGRCSIDGSKIWMNCNPKGPRHFIKTDYIDQIKNPKKSICRIHFYLEDNPTLSPQKIQFYKSQFQGVFYKRNILGLWVMAEGVIYDMWNEEKYTFTEAPNRFDEYQVWCDYGIHNPMVFLLVGKRYNPEHQAPEFWVLKEYYYNSREVGIQKTDALYRKDLLDFIDGYDITRVIIDPSAASFIQELAHNTRLSIDEADNDVENGIRMMASTIGQGRFLVHESCKNILREFESYVWDDKAAQRGEDKPLKENDHCLDAARYGIMTQGGIQLYV
jgi:PBSX family phage terminase large subunit